MFTYTYEYVSPKLVIGSAVDTIRSILAKKQSLRKFKSDFNFARKVKGKFLLIFVHVFYANKSNAIFAK